MEIDNDDWNSVSTDGKSFSALPFFMQLPNELKLKILDSVSGVEIAKVSCVCSELRYLLASSDDLWKQKYVAEFGNYKVLWSEGSFKERFAKASEGRKRNRNGGSSLNKMRMSMNLFTPFGGDLGGDDREWLNIARLCLPGVGAPRRRNAILQPNCNLEF